jgi:hypothetical protein
MPSRDLIELAAQGALKIVHAIDRQPYDVPLPGQPSDFLCRRPAASPPERAVTLREWFAVAGCKRL